MSELSDSRKIPPNAAALPLIKAKAIEQVDLSETEDSKRHASFAALRRIRFLASSQSLNFALPLFIARSASRNACACHAGDSNRSSSLERSAQSASIARNFSSRDIFFNGRATGMNTRVDSEVPMTSMPMPGFALRTSECQMLDAAPFASDFFNKINLFHAFLGSLSFQVCMTNR